MAELPIVDDASTQEINALINRIGSALQSYIRSHPDVSVALRNISIACASVSGDQAGRLDALFPQPRGNKFYHDQLIANFDEGYKDAFAEISQEIARREGLHS